MKDNNHGPTCKSTDRELESKFDQGSRSLSINLHCPRACGLEGYKAWVRVDQAHSDALTYHMSIHFRRVHLFSPVEISYYIIIVRMCITLSCGPQSH